MGITHILNTAEGSRFGQVDTGHAYYRDVPQIRYMGFPLTDHPSTDISRYFYIAAKFIDNAISSGGQFFFWRINIALKLFNVTFLFVFLFISGKVLVHCQVDTGIISLSMTYYWLFLSFFLLFRWEYLDHQLALLFISWFIEKCRHPMPFARFVWDAIFSQMLASFNN